MIACWERCQRGVHGYGQPCEKRSDNTAARGQLTCNEASGNLKYTEKISMPGLASLGQYQLRLFVTPHHRKSHAPTCRIQTSLLSASTIRDRTSSIGCIKAWTGGAGAVGRYCTIIGEDNYTRALARLACFLQQLCSCHQNSACSALLTSRGMFLRRNSKRIFSFFSFHWFSAEDLSASPASSPAQPAPQASWSCRPLP